MQTVNLKSPSRWTWLLFLAFSLPLFADGFIIIEPPSPRPPVVSFQPFPLAVKNHIVNVSIDDQAAVTNIDQTFINPTSRQLQGYYIFPIPKNATIDKFTMFIDGKETAAELLDAEKAREMYEDIVRRMVDPALLEYSGQGLLKVRIFPIEPNGKKNIRIAYSEVLEKDFGTTSYTYPLNTEKFSSKPLEEVSISVEVKSSQKIKAVYCPSHQTEINSKNAFHSVVGFEAKNVKPDRDFHLYYLTREDQIGASLLSTQEKGEEGYFMLTLSPGFPELNQEIAAKDIAFVLDVSGSMAGEKLAKAKSALGFCIENLNKQDRFQIIRFSTQAEAFFDQLTPYTQRSKTDALAFVKNLKAIGGTNIDEALTLALEHPPEDGRPYFVIFITDGKPTVGAYNEQVLLEKISKSNHHNARIFTFGIGEDINTHLLDKITEQTGAIRSYIAPDEDIEIKISNFYRKVSAPVLTDIKVTVNNNLRLNRMYPRQIPDLFRGSAVTILGRYRGTGKTSLTISGEVNGRQVKYNQAVDFKKSGDGPAFIAPLWASRVVGYLLDQIRLKGETKELKEEIISLARQYGIVTPYTSYLIIEDEARLSRENRLDDRFQLLAPNMEDSQAAMEESRGEYEEMKRKSGGGSVRSSKEVQSLRGAANIADTHQGKSRMAYRNKDGHTENLAAQHRFINGRAFYRSGENWIDSAIYKNATTNVRQVKFASNEYFALVKNNPEIADIYALGKNVTFFWNNMLHEIIE